MSLAYSDTTNQDGLIQRIEQELGFPEDYITGNNTRMAQWAGSINLALDKVFHIIFGADGKWQFDDGNHTTDPILTTNLVDGQRDYPFSSDAGGNLILDIHRVFIRTSTTTPYTEIYPVDMHTDPESEISNFVDGLNTEGVPYKYDKTARSIFLDPIPNSNVTAGLKVFVSREGSYFATAPTFDTTKVAGFSGLYHEYLVLEPCYRYARANNLNIKETLKRDVLELESNIREYYSRRARDERTIMTPEPIIYE